MTTSSPARLSRERNIILFLLLLLAALAWGVLWWQAGASDMGDASMGLAAAPVFLAVWIVMMVAMMFPTAAPMILTFARVHATKREQGRTFVPTWVFVSGYLLIWTLFGAAAFGLALLGQALIEGAGVGEHAPRIAGATLAVAGMYQFSPLKNMCLSKCRTPFHFILTSWREGRLGAFRMGLEHGMYCLGCCWLLFVILFPLGMTNVAIMALITALIFAEKSLPIGRQAGALAGALLIAYGLSALLVPQLLPTTMTGL